MVSGYTATPQGSGPWPGVVMVHEAFGIDANTRRQADRLAKAGFLTHAVDLFANGGARRCLVSTFKAMSKGEGKAFDDIEAARSQLAASSDCTGKVGIIGFCMGGGFALLSANRGFDAASVNYGQLPDDLDTALIGACPMITSYGAKDLGLKGATAKLEASLSKNGVTHDATEYPTAGHGFLNDTTPGPRLLQPLMRVGGIKPDPEASSTAWPKIEAFFAQHLT